MLSLIWCLLEIRKILGFAHVAGEWGPQPGQLSRAACVTDIHNSVVFVYWPHLQLLRDAVGTYWLSVSERCSLALSYQRNVAAPVIVITENPTVFQGACCSYTSGCSQISIRWYARFLDIYLKILCDSAVLREEVNGWGRNWSGYLAAILEL